MGKDKDVPEGYTPLLELDLRRKREGGRVRVPGEFRGAADAIARREALVLVHGYNNTYGQAAEAYFAFRTRQSRTYSPRDPLTFDRYFADTFWPGDANWWPGFDKLDFAVYPLAVSKAREAARELAALLGRLPNLLRVDFIGHSLGCRVVLETLFILAERGAPRIGRVCLMAAAVPLEMLEPPDGRFHELLYRLAAARTQIYVMHSKSDPVLHFAFPVGQAAAGLKEASKRALGRHGPTVTIPGFGASVRGDAIPNAKHGDYWGHSDAPATTEAAAHAGRFLALGELPRQMPAKRSVGAPMDPLEARALRERRDV